MYMGFSREASWAAAWMTPMASRPGMNNSIKTIWGFSALTFSSSALPSFLAKTTWAPFWDNFWIGPRPHSPSSELIIIFICFSMTNLLKVLVGEKILP